MNKRPLLILFAAWLLPLVGWCQQPRPLQLDIRSNLLTQKIDFMEGPQVLTRIQLEDLMQQASPEVQESYLIGRNAEKLNVIFSVAETGLALASLGVALIPQSQSSQFSNLGLPLIISAMATGVIAGVFRRKARNVMRETVILYNSQLTSEPLYYQDPVPVQQVLSFNIPLN